MRVARLASHETPEALLRWYWNQSDGDIGLRSSFPAMVARIETGVHVDGPPQMEFAEWAIEAATKARLISRALEETPERYQRILVAAYGPCAFELPVLGALAPLAPMTLAAREAHKASGTDHGIGEWLAGLCALAAKRGRGSAGSGEARRLVAAIAAESEATRKSALRAFAVVHAARGSTAR